MSLVDFTPPPAEDETMDRATKQNVDSHLAVSAARHDAKLAEFRATVEAYTARAEEREIAAKERELARAKDFARVEASMVAIRRAITTSTVSAILGIAALNAALYQGILYMLDVGRQFGATQAEIQRQLRVMEMLLQPKEDTADETIPPSGLVEKKRSPNRH